MEPAHERNNLKTVAQLDDLLQIKDARVIIIF